MYRYAPKRRGDGIRLAQVSERQARGCGEEAAMTEEMEPDLTESARLAQKEMREIFLEVRTELANLRGFVKDVVNVNATPEEVERWMDGRRVAWVDGVPEVDALNERYFDADSVLRGILMEWRLADRELIEETENIVYSGDFRLPHLEQVCVEYRKKIHLRPSEEVVIP